MTRKSVVSLCTVVPLGNWNKTLVTSSPTNFAYAPSAGVAPMTGVSRELSLYHPANTYPSFSGYVPSSL